MKEIKVTLSKKTKKPALWTGERNNIITAVLNHNGDPKRAIYVGSKNRVLIPLHKGDYIMEYDKATDTLETYQIRDLEEDTAICRTVSPNANVPEYASEIIAEMHQEGEEFEPPFDRNVSWYGYVETNSCLKSEN